MPISNTFKIDIQVVEEFGGGIPTKNTYISITKNGPATSSSPRIVMNWDDAKKLYNVLSFYMDRKDPEDMITAIIKDVDNASD